MDNSPVELVPGVFWLGDRSRASMLRCNPYLIVDGGEGVLIEPGSPLDFEAVSANLAAVLPLERVKYIVLGHQDPDLAASVPLFERAGFSGRIACHWRASLLVAFYGVASEFYRVDENSNSLVFGSGRRLSFIPTPYLHFPGAIATYDERTRTLFSSDLFGAITPEWSLFARKDRYLEPMKAFHEHYMPSSDILRPVMESLARLDIEIIAPQHGSIIREDVGDYIAALRDLECGSFLHAGAKDLAEAGGYTGIFGRVVERLAGVYPKGEVVEAFEGSGVALDPESLAIVDLDGAGEDLWNSFFERLLARKGSEWLMIAEVLVDRLSSEYALPLPSVYRARSARATREIDRLAARAEELRDARSRLEARLRDTEEGLIRDAASGLYNERFFRDFLKAEIAALDPGECGPAVMAIGVDRMGEFIIRRGEAAGEEAVKSMAYLLGERLGREATLCGIPGGAFAAFIPDGGDEAALKAEAESVRAAVAASRIFLEPLTVSIGLARMPELARAGMTDPRRLPQALLAAAKARLAAARKAGMDRVVSSSRGKGDEDLLPFVVAADPDESNRGILRSALEKAGFRAAAVADGLQLLELIEADRPDFVVSELMLPKLDALAVRERMLASSELRAIPFMIVSHKKDEESLRRAHSLGIEHYLKKPYFLSEAIGIVALRARKTDIPS